MRENPSSLGARSRAGPAPKTTLQARSCSAALPVRGSSKPSQHSIKRSKIFPRAANHPRPGRIHLSQNTKSGQSGARIPNAIPLEILARSASLERADTLHIDRHDVPHDIQPLLEDHRVFNQHAGRSDRTIDDDWLSVATIFTEIF